jgi:prevent-host-death family protein
MKRTVSAMDARRQFGALLEGVFYRGDEVTIERAGKVMGVVVPADRYEAMAEQERAAARKRLFAIIDEIHARNAHIPEEEVWADVQQAVDEVRAERARQ